MINKLAVLLLAVIVAALFVPRPAAAGCTVKVEIRASLTWDTEFALRTSVTKALHGRGVPVVGEDWPSCKVFRVALTATAQQTDTASSDWLAGLVASQAPEVQQWLAVFLGTNRSSSRTFQTLRLDGHLIRTGNGLVDFAGWIEANVLVFSDNSAAFSFTTSAGLSGQKRVQATSQTNLASQILDLMVLALVEQIPISRF